MLYLHVPEHKERWLNAFTTEAPDIHIVTETTRVAPEDVRWVAAWGPTEGLLSRFPNVEVVFGLGAGVDKFLRLPDLPKDVPLVRLVDAGMGRQMAEYALFALLWFQRDMDVYMARKARNEWQPELARSAEQMRVGVLGVGALGSTVARTLSDLGYPVTGWKRSPGAIDGIPVRSGADGLDEVLRTSDMIVSLLPDTEETRGLLDRERLSRLPRGAAVVNVGRGSLIVAEDLIALLDQGHLRGAVLDVFATEPLPQDSPLWSHPKVIVTPHVSAETLPEPAARQVAANIRRLQMGEQLVGLVDTRRGY